MEQSLGNIGVVFEQAAYGLLTSENTTNSEALLRCLRDLLLTVVPPETDPEPMSTKNSIVYMLGENNGAWANMGVSELDAAVWESFAFTPVTAKIWLKQKVTAPLAFLLVSTGLSSDMYVQIAKFYDVNMDNANERQKLHRKILEVFSSGSLTPAQAIKWLSVNISLEQAVLLRLRGMTPTKIKCFLSEGKTVEEILESFEAVDVPGTSYPVVLGCAKTNGWAVKEIEQKPTVTKRVFIFTKQTTEVTVSFSQTGRISNMIRIKTPAGVRLRRPGGVKNIVKTMKIVEP